MVKVVCTIIEYFDWVNHKLSMIEDIKLDNDHFLLEMHNSMFVILVFVIDLVLKLDNMLFYLHDEDKQ